MSGTVLVSTHRLPLAGAIRDAFEREGYAVDLIPGPDHLASAEEHDEPLLLVLTGEASPEEGLAWVRDAHRGLEIPLFAVLPGAGGVARGRALGAEEAFGPDPDLDELVLLAHRAIQRRRLQKLIGIVGEAESIREVLERVVQIAPVDSTVLVTGESGTGKELVARGIHALSPRRHRAFLAVNVAALSDTLLESELFGHEKGAFTGAIDSRRGFFELAHRGTLFLDEIGEMPLSTQTKLLRVLEQREFLRVGGEKAIQTDVRIIAATNQELRHLVAEGGFRRDLYYRLNILGIELPALRRRREDIPRLVHHFVRQIARQMDRPFPGISEEAMALLIRYDWPGNVRELRNLVESMVVLAPGRVIGPLDIPAEIRVPGGSNRLLPAPVNRPVEDSIPADERAGSEGRGRRPELEFIFRTLVDLRMDVDQLRQEFDRYREEDGARMVKARRGSFALPASRSELQVDGVEESGEKSGDEPVRAASDEGPAAEGTTVEGEAEPPDQAEEEESGAVVFRSGMTIEDMEREAIRTVLSEVGGNRRMAAESLGIGERTLYRKIRKYGIEA